MNTYGLTFEEIAGIANLISILDDMTAPSERGIKTAIERAHETIERVLGPDAGLVYDQEEAA